ncbi:MAG: S8 family serine peptidase, partial [Dehalococcoidales bacterium]|nr:S8 family serine peptidase [Dehalococcoidales bacterium]
TGTIAQSTHNGVGVAGIAFNTTIMPIKVLNSAGIGTTDQVADGIRYAADNGANIINLSLGGSGSAQAMEEAIAYASNAGVIVIAAAGNTGDAVPQYPASYDDYVISVSATRYDQARPAYSSYGSHIDIAAPGGDLTVNQNGDGYADGVLQMTFDPITQDPTDFGYYFLQGTSMAAPHVAGVAALVLAKHPTWTTAQVRYAIQSTATDIGTPGRDDDFGWGLINASAAVGASLPATTSYKDASRTTECNNFIDYTSEHTVYMKSTNLLPEYDYRMVYFDGDGDKRATQDFTSDASGNLITEHTFVAGTDTAGTWHVIVCDAAHTPASEYDAGWTYTIAEDTFTVQQSAIPEFPTILAAGVSLTLCAGIYLLMRRKLTPARAASRR